jgi:hypothetical protein
MRDLQHVAGVGPPRLPPALAGLMAPLAYPHPVDAVELIETPIAWVLLAGQFAYKVKRPVRYPFIDLTSAERRRLLCEEELRLNRRFAPALYLEVCEIVSVEGAARIRLRTGESGQAHRGILEHAVRMRRFSRRDELDHLLASHHIEPVELEAFGRSLAEVHAGLPEAQADSLWGTPQGVQTQLVRNLLECAEAAGDFGTAEEVLALRQVFEQRILAARSCMAVRREAGRVRECHGDLHSRNIVRLDARLVAFDCLEYEPAFRWIDVADEIAFLTSDLGSRHCGRHAHAFLSGYLARSGDYHACRLIRLYEVHRALVRAKVAALSAAGLAQGPERQSLRQEHQRLIAHAAAALTPGKPLLLLMCGLSGSGKTWLARLLAERLSALHLRSDVERKRRAGLGSQARSGSGLAEGLYSSRMSACVYDDLARAAQDGLTGGYNVIVDATFLRREQRTRFAALGATLGSPARFVCCQAPLPVLRARVLARARVALDPSEADLSVLDWQRGRIEPFGPDDPFDVTYVESADPQALEKVLRRTAHPPARQCQVV